VRFWVSKGGREKINNESDVHLPQPPKKSSHLLYFILVCFYFLCRFCCVDFFVSRFWAFRNKGGSKTRLKNRRNFSAAAKKSTHSLTSFFSPTAPLGVSRQEEFENTENKLSTFQKKSPGIFFPGGFSDFFFFRLFCCVGTVG
jgi:hypothetical protein